MSTSFDGRQSDAVLAAYRSRANELEVEIADLEIRERWDVVIAIACTVTGAVLFLLALHGSVLLFAVCAILLFEAMRGLRRILRARATAIDLARRLNLYERGIDRMGGNWRGQGRGGMEFAREHHLYEADLDILGEGSLFELMATTRSEIGAERLTDFSARYGNA